MSAATPSSRQASATSNTTRPQAIRPIARPVPIRPPSRSSESSDGREARQAAGRPAISVEQERRADRDDRHAVVDVERPPARAVVQHALDRELDAIERDGCEQQADHRRERADHEAFRQHVRRRAGRARRQAPSGPSSRARGRRSARAGGSRRLRRRSAARSRPRSAASDELRGVADEACSRTAFNSKRPLKASARLPP